MKKGESMEKEKIIKAVESYIQGEKSAKQLSEELNVRRSTIQLWVRKHHKHGTEWMLSRDRKVYTESLKYAAAHDYMSAILDLDDNSIVSYVLGRFNNNALVFKTFDKAITANPDAKPLFHSDRGFQYTNRIFSKKLDDIGAVQRMSRVGRCIDNGPMEGFWGCIKSEMFYLESFFTFDQLEKAVDNYIVFYNTKRFQKKLKNLAPFEFRCQAFGS